MERVTDHGYGWKRLACLSVLGVLISLGACVSAFAQDDADTPQPSFDDGPSYDISSLSLGYVKQSEGLPPLAELSAIKLEIGISGGAYVMPRPGVEMIESTIDELGKQDIKQIRFSGLQYVLEVVLAELNNRQMISVFVAPDPLHISDSGEDLRGGATELRLLIATGSVTEVRSLASGERLPADIEEDERVNHPLHARIRDRSPIQPEGQTAEEQINIIRKDILDRYIFQLSRHPGRRVDVALSPSEEQGGVTLDYDITENRPLVIYGQISNTGTEQTSRWRERIGFFHTQLTNNDDILSFDYTTTNFDESNALSLGYEAPFGTNDRLRWRIYGAWSEFTASEVGFFDDTFEGESWSLGGEVAWNFYQDREFFLDFLAGARYDDIDVDNRAFAIKGHENFFIPYFGLRMERNTEWFNTQGSLIFEFQSDSINNVDMTELVGLGRLSPDDSWTIMQWDISHSFYLEPLLNREGWEDPTTPGSSTLAHEIALAFRGQHSFGDRLIPQAEGVVGGLYSVRGYPESLVAGDTILIASAEYRFHLPRAFGIQPEPGELFGEPFRWAPQYVYGQPDWDLILKGFIDIGRADNSGRQSFETDEDLIGAGVGIELQIKRNVNVRLDWGFALEGTEAGSVDSGSNRLHFVATFLF